MPRYSHGARVMSSSAGRLWQGWLRVGGEKRKWELGKCIGFDDSFEHEVYYNHPTDPRAVLIMDVWHPDMTENTRMGCINTAIEQELYNYHKYRFIGSNNWFNSTAFP